MGAKFLVAQLCVVAMAAVAIFAAISDIRSLTIPNAVPVLIFALFVPYVVVSQLPWSQTLLSIGLATIVCAVGFGFFAAGIIGGGDAKFLAAASLWAGPRDLAMLVLATALAGGCIAFLFLVPPIAHRIRRLRRTTFAAAVAPNVMPYGVAIAAATMLVAYGRLG